MKTLQSCLMLLLLLTHMGSTASAFYVLDDSGKTRSQSRGHDVPFAHALKMIVPLEQGWELVVEGDGGLSLKDVSWGDEETWEEAVLSVAEQADSDVVFDFEAKKLYIKRNPPEGLPQKQESTKSTGVPAETKGVAPLLSGEVPPDVIREQEEAPEWTIKPGGLREQLQGWAERADYQVAWTARNDHQISVSATIRGEFVDAIQMIFESLYRNGSNLRSKVYAGNNVIKVWEE